MDKRDLLLKYINSIKRKKLLTDFIAYIFDYNNFYDYSYIFRISKEKDNIVIDIYDNISTNRFNRYIFEYSDKNYKTTVTQKGSVYLTYINIKKIDNTNNKLYKLAYLFKLNKEDMLDYAKTFLDEKYIQILINIIK